MVSGIYKIIINSKVYIGSSKNCYKRFKDHLSALKNNRHCNVKTKSRREVAKQFGVYHGTINKVVNGKTWKETRSNHRGTKARN
jgi:hypothetical protein